MPETLNARDQVLLAVQVMYGHREDDDQVIVDDLVTRGVGELDAEKLVALLT